MGEHEIRIRDRAYITAGLPNEEPHTLDRSQLFRPGLRPVGVVLPDNAWHLGFCSVEFAPGTALTAIARRVKTARAERTRWRHDPRARRLGRICPSLRGPSRRLAPRPRDRVPRALPLRSREIRRRPVQAGRPGLGPPGLSHGPPVRLGPDLLRPGGRTIRLRPDAHGLGHVPRADRYLYDLADLGPASGSTPATNGTCTAISPAAWPSCGGRSSWLTASERSTSSPTILGTRAPATKITSPAWRRCLACAREIPLYEKLLTIPGIGRILGLTITMEVGDVRRFPTEGDFASYCRTVDARRTSNGKSKGDNNAKCGNAYLSWAFVEAANFAKRSDANCRRWYDRKAARTSTVLATKALACKLAKMAWHLMTHQSDYNEKRLFPELAMNAK